MTREELLKSPEYWTTLIQNELYRQIQAYMEEHNMNKAQLAEHLGCSRGYVTQLLNGDFDHKISKLVELSLAIGMVPSVQFKELEDGKAGVAQRLERPRKILRLGVRN